MANLESELSAMSDSLSQYRSTLPRKIIQNIAYTLDDNRPHDDGDVDKPRPYINIAKKVPLVKEDQETAKRAQVLKQKISDNVSAMPILLRRMRDAISRLDKSNSFKLVIPPIYKKKRTS